jgi:general secretion pathway protein G
MGYLGTSRTKTAKVQIESISTSLELFKLDVGRYPNEREGLAALITRPGNVAGWNGPYLQKDKVPADPWGQSYHYRYPGRNGRFEIYTFGADNNEGGESEDQDVASWM